MFYGWIVLLVLCFNHVVLLCGTLYTYGSILVPMAEELGLTMTQAAAGQTILSISSSFISLIVGQLLATKFQPKTAILGAGVCGMIGCGLMGFVVRGSGLYYLVYALFISVMNVCGTGVVSQTLLTRWFDYRRSIAVAAQLSMGGVGGFIFPLITTGLLQHTGSWRPIWIVVMCLCGVSFILTAIFVKNCPEELGLVKDGGSFGNTAKRDKPLRVYRTPISFTCREAMKTPYFYVHILTQMSISIGMTVMGSYLIAHLTLQGVGATAAAAAVSVFAFFNFFGRLSSGFVMDKVDPRTVLRVCLPFMGTVLLFSPHISTAAQAWIFAGCFGLGFSFSVTAPVNILMNVYGVAHYSQIVTVEGMGANILKSLVALAAGVTYDATGSYSLYFLLLSGIMFGGGILQLVTKVPKHPSVNAEKAVVAE